MDGERRDQPVEDNDRLERGRDEDESMRGGRREEICKIWWWRRHRRRAGRCQLQAGGSEGERGESESAREVRATWLGGWGMGIRVWGGERPQWGGLYCLP